MKNISYLFILSLLFSCQNNSKRDWSREQFQAHMNSSSIHKKAYWKKWLDLPLEERVIAATPEMKIFLRDDNEFNEYPSKPKIIKLTKEHKETIKEAIGGLPDWIKKPIEKKITAIMIIEDLGGSALTDAVRGFKNKGFIVFDLKTLTKTSNEWCTWKETSVFIPGKYKIKCTLANKNQDSKVAAFRYIFLHEAAHILNMGSPVLPFWNNESKKTPADTKRYPFLKLSWKFDESGRIVKNRKYKYLDNINYYKPQYASFNKEMLSYYKELESSDFATLYGATNSWDDLAESYVNYIHTQIFKKPFKIEIFKDDNLVYTYKDCWQKKRCQQKKKMIKKFIKGI